MLKSERDPALRRFAARKLQESPIWNRDEVEILVESLKDNDLGVKDISALTLSETKNQKAKLAAEELSMLMNNSNLELRVLASEILENIGIPSTEFILKYLKDENPNIRKLTLDTLGRIKDSKSIDHIKDLLNDNNINVVCSAIEALGNLKSIKYSKSLINLYNREIDTKLYIIEALGKIGGAEAHQFLKALLKNETEIGLRCSIVDSLSLSCSDKETLNILISEFPKTEVRARGIFLKAIVAIATRCGANLDFEAENRQLFVECLQDNELDVRAAALLALGSKYLLNEIDIIYQQFKVETKEIQRYILLNILSSNDSAIIEKFFFVAFAKGNTGDNINDVLSVLPFVYPTAKEENCKIIINFLASKALSDQISFYREIFDALIQVDYNFALERIKIDIYSKEKSVAESAIEVAIAYNLNDILGLLNDIKHTGVLTDLYIDDAILRLSW